MKSLAIILFVFLLLNINSHALNLKSNYESLDSSFTQDSTYTKFKNDTLLSNIEIQSIVSKIEELIKKDNKLNYNDYKRLAISYAEINNIEKSTEYILEYIQKTYDTSVLDLKELRKLKGSSEFLGLKKRYAVRMNGLIAFFLAVGIVGVFISIILNFRKSGDTISNLLISFFVLFLSVFILHRCLYFSRLHFKMPNILYASTGFTFLYGPLIFFYFKRISEKYKFRLNDIVHLIPTVILFLFLIPIYLKTSDEKLHLMFNNSAFRHNFLVTVVVFKAISLSVYCYLIFKFFYNKALTNKYVEVIKWKRNVMFLNSFHVFVYIIYGLTIIIKNAPEEIIYFQVFSMTLIVIYISYAAYVQPIIFNKEYLFNDLILKYQKSGLTPKLSIELKHQLLILLEKEKIYKVNDLNLDCLAEIVGTSRHNISQVINEHFNLNFFNLINKYRIEEAQQLLLNDINKNLNIIDIAYDVGFNNKVTFNKAFKEITNVTPTQFIRDNKKKTTTIIYYR